MVAKTNSTTTSSARKNAATSPELMPSTPNTSLKNQLQKQRKQLSPIPAQQQPPPQPRPGVFSRGHVKRLAQAREDSSVVTRSTSRSISSKRINNVPTKKKADNDIPKYVTQSNLSASGVVKKTSAKTVSSFVDQYGITTRKNSSFSNLLKLSKSSSSSHVALEIDRMLVTGSTSNNNINNVPSKKADSNIPNYVAQSNSSASSVGKKTGAKTTSSVVDRYGIPTRKNISSSASLNSFSKSSSSSTRHRNTLFQNAGRKKSAASAAPALPSLLNNDDATINSAMLNTGEIRATELYQKFEEAFNMTLRNNPGILPGAPTVIESIKNALFKVQKSREQEESEMRRQLDKVNSEKDQLEAQLRKEMGTTSLRRNELTKELEAAKGERSRAQDSLTKQTEAIQAIKHELASKMDDLTEEKEELTKHLTYLSKSHSQLEQALETEMKLVEKDRIALETVMAERKKLQKQKLENEELEAKIEQMTQAASKEKKALQAEITDLQKFEDYLSSIKEQNEESRAILEKERGQLKELAETMQTKKSALKESKSELEGQYQAEIDELEGQIQSTKMMHEQDMEMVVKNRVMNYLRQTCGDTTDVCRGMEIMDCTGSILTGASNVDCVDVPSLIKLKVETELQSRMKEFEDQKKKEAELQSRLKEAELQLRLKELEDKKKDEEKNKKKKKERLSLASLSDDDNSLMEQEIVDADSGDDEESLDLRKTSKKNSKSKKKKQVDKKNKGEAENDKKEEAKMKKEIDSLRVEIELVKARGSTNTRSSENNMSLRTSRTPDVMDRFRSRPRLHHHAAAVATAADDADIREEIRSLRDEIKMSQHAAQTPPQAPPVPPGRGRFMMSPGVSSRPLQTPPQPLVAVEDTREEMQDIREDLQCLRDVMMMSNHHPAPAREPLVGHHRPTPPRAAGGNRFLSPGSRPTPAPSSYMNNMHHEADENDIREQQRDERRRVSHPLPRQQTEQRISSNHNRFISPVGGGGRPPSKSYSQETERCVRFMSPAPDRGDENVGSNRSSYSHQRHLRGRPRAYSNNDDSEKDVVGRLHLATPPLRSELRSRRLLNPRSSVRSSSVGRSTYYS
mmetsp:Transcript_16891/g.30650  ORF Transcript_16891/g.30650 Transcript_16891/m.30650 type:complete len:1083 (+) Transcript_16891:221-3469(+)